MQNENTPAPPLDRLKAFIAEGDYQLNSRLPPERELCRLLGFTRTALRKSLATLESEGQLWRHVGKGTFVGSRPIEDLTDIRTITGRTNPVEVMRTRQLIEPEIARLAALNATGRDVEKMRLCMARSRAADSWRQYESWDNRLHRVIAESTHNNLLLSLFDTLNSVRRAVVWGRLRSNKLKPDPDHHSFAEHEALVGAIAERDLERAAEAMRRHLETVERNLLNRRAAAAE
jgi:DNA-binding FadR family transcriptional regulator